MKQLSLFTLLCIISLTIFAQSENHDAPHLKLNKGIYLSFDQIKKDSPGITDSFIIKERTSGNIAMWGGGKYTFEFASKDKTEFKKIRKELIGMSDGENFYISDKFTVNGWQGMTLCRLSGPYLIAPIKGSAAQYTAGGLIPSMIKVGSGFLINLNDGTSRQLSKKVIKELLKKYPEISKKYADKGDLIEYASEIINEINKTEKRE